MTSKEALEYIAKEKGIDNITGAVEYNWKLYQPCFQTINKDLDRLDKLEKVIEIMKNKYIIPEVVIISFYQLYFVFCKQKGVSEERIPTPKEFALVKEVLEDGK